MGNKHRLCLLRDVEWAIRHPKASTMSSSPVDFFWASHIGQFTAPKKADAAGEDSAVVYVVGEKVGRVDVMVDADSVFTGRHV